MRKKEGDSMSAYSSLSVPTRFVEANGIRFAYRRWGKQSGIPLVFNQHSVSRGFRFPDEPFFGQLTTEDQSDESKD
jgi:hypothetical protein